MLLHCRRSMLPGIKINMLRFARFWSFRNN
jgi:hypothetical protein